MTLSSFQALWYSKYEHDKKDFDDHSKFINMSCRTMHRRVMLCKHVVSLFHEAGSTNTRLQNKNVFNKVLQPLETSHNEYMIINTHLTPYHVYRKRYYSYTKEVTKVLKIILKSYTNCSYSVSYYEHINASIRSLIAHFIKLLHTLNERHDSISMLQHKYLNRTNSLYELTTRGSRKASKRYLKFCITIWKKCIPLVDVIK